MKFEFLKGAFEAAKKAQATIEKEIDNCERKKEKARQELDELRTLPYSREEAIKILEQKLDNWSGPFEDVIKTYFTKTVPIWQRTAETPDNIVGKPDRRFNPLGVRILDPQQSPGLGFGVEYKSEAVRTGSLLAVLAPLLKSRIREIVEALPWPERIAPPEPERIARIQELEKEIRELEGNINAMLEQARAAGVDI